MAWFWPLVASLLGGGEQDKGGKGNSPSVSVNSLQNMMSQQMNQLRQDKGFYGHMTVKKAQKGKRIKIIGTGE